MHRITVRSPRCLATSSLRERVRSPLPSCSALFGLVVKRSCCGASPKQCGRPTSRNGPRARHRRSIFFTSPQGTPASKMTAQGVTRFLHTHVQTDMELLSVLKAAARRAGQRRTRRLKHCTLGPPRSRHQPNLSFLRRRNAWKSFLRTKCQNLILKTHDRETMDRRSDHLCSGRNRSGDQTPVDRHQLLVRPRSDVGVLDEEALGEMRMRVRDDSE